MSELRTDTITASDGTSPVTLTKQSAPKAWLSYDQSVPTVNDSFNQSSTTDVSVGRYNLNFTNSMTNKHYSVAGVGASTVIFCQRTTDNNATNASSASSCRVESFYFTGSSFVNYYDSKPTTMVVNGDLA